MEARHPGFLLQPGEMAAHLDLAPHPDLAPPATKKKARRGGDPANQKRRCVSTACIACRKRKSKCDGALPSCAACASVYGTECVYDPNSDHRRKGVYREKIDSMKARNSTLQILIEAILNADDDDVADVVRRIRTCDSLDDVAEAIVKEEQLPPEAAISNADDAQLDEADTADRPYEGERELARKMGELRLENGSVRYIGGTSHLIYMGDPADAPTEEDAQGLVPSEDAVTSWSDVTKDRAQVLHLLNLYFNWHYPYFATLSRSLFFRDFFRGKPPGQPKGTAYCSSLLVNAMLALGCHFSSMPCAFAVPGDNRTKGDHFFVEAKKLIVENDEYEKPRLVTVQALAIMSVREAGCGREAKGWVYSGMSFRMAQDIGLNLDAGAIAADKESMDEKEIDARRITFWGCFLFDKCWSNYLGRLPQLPKNSYNVAKYDVFPDEDGEDWSPYTDSGPDASIRQPARTRAVGLQLTKLCEISSDLLLFFYHPNHIGRSSGKSVELKKLSELHRRLEEWHKELPKELEPREGQLPNVILMHMFYHLQYIHLFRPFLKYTPSASPLPPHVSPRRICTANAGSISKLMRLYKKTYNLRQICNIAVYMVHSACTIHLLNLPEKTARRDIIHGVKQLEEIAEDWLCARRTLSILSVLARKWNVELPDEASAVLQRTDEQYGHFSTSDVPSPHKFGLSSSSSPPALTNPPAQIAPKQEPYGSSNPYSQSSLTPPPPQQQHMGQGAAAPALPPDVFAGLPRMGPPPSGPIQQQQPPHDTSGPGLSLGDGYASVGAWAMPVAQPGMTAAAAAYHQAYTTMPGTASSAGSTSAGSQMPSRQVTPSQQQQQQQSNFYALDGQDWFLKDGVSWQQNFEGWGLGAAGNPPVSMGGGDRGPVYMFKGMQGNELDTVFDFGDRLPGLE